MISVAICTWNRAQLLDQTLDHLARMRIPGGVEWEILVVNNNCTDDTDRVLEKHFSHLPLRRLLEPKQGHSHARNCAMEAARGNLIVWTDDDVLVDPEWLFAYIEAAKQWPETTYFGGPVDPLFSISPPGWVVRHLSVLRSPYALRDYGSTVRPLSASEEPFGANMAIRRDRIGRLRFDDRLGRKGSEMISGDESDFFQRLKQEGHSGVWVGTARVQHYIPPDRLSLDYVKRYFEGHGRTSVRQGGLAVGRTLGGVPLWVLRKHYTASFAVWALKPFQNRSWFEALKRSAVSRGMICEFREHRLEQRRLRQA